MNWKFTFLIKQISDCEEIYVAAIVKNKDGHYSRTSVMQEAKKI